MIRCKTVSYKDTSLEEEEEFDKFNRLLVEEYPAINTNCKLYNIGRTGVLYHWEGKCSDKPVVLMAHYDVVPVSKENWDKEPFSATIEGGYIWGRGTLDTKGTLCGIMEAAEKLIRDGFKPGHASSPPPESPVGILSKAVLNIERKPFSYRLSQPAKDMFDVLGRNSSFGLKILFANIYFFKPLVNLITRKSGGELNALVRTTTAFTKMSGSDAVNVFPPYASIEGDIRIMQGDTQETIIKGYRKRINDKRVIVESLDYIPVTKFSSMNTEAWMLLEYGIKEVWKDTKVSPYLMIASSDSRHFTQISDNVYRFSAMELSNDERKLIHGNNERIPIEKLLTTVKFYICMMKKI